MLKRIMGRRGRERTGVDPARSAQSTYGSLDDDARAPRIRRRSPPAGLRPARANFVTKQTPDQHLALEVQRHRP